MLRDIPSGKLRALPAEAAVNVKDRLRDVRDFIRAHRHDRLSGRGLTRQWETAGSPVDTLGLLSHAASMVDDTLTLAETVSATLLAGQEGAGPRALTAYFPAGAAGSWRAERAFRRDMHAAAKRASAAFRLETDTLREWALRTAHSAMRRRHGTLLAELRCARGPQPQSVARVTAALSLELRQAVASEVGWRGGGEDEKAFARRYVPGLLCSALATLEPNTAGEPELFGLALLATDARQDRIGGALSEGSPDLLAAVFAALLAHLP